MDVALNPLRITGVGFVDGLDAGNVLSGEPATGTGNRGDGAAGGAGLGPAPPSVGWPQSGNRGPFWKTNERVTSSSTT